MSSSTMPVIRKIGFAVSRFRIKCFLVRTPCSPLFFSLLVHLGLVIGLEKLEDITEEAMDTMIDTNVKGLVHVTQAVLPGMRARDKGHIINIGSVAGHQAYGNGSIYCGSKAAVASITKALLFETIDTAIRISEINPGMLVLIFVDSILASSCSFFCVVCCCFFSFTDGPLLPVIILNWNRNGRDRVLGGEVQGRQEQGGFSLQGCASVGWQ